MRQTILCVDDELIILNSLKTQLQTHVNKDVSIECVESAEEALSLIDELTEAGEEIALVISDQIMPEMTGDKLLMRIHEKLAKTNKILLTGHADNNDVFNLVKKINLYRYIPKPWNLADLQMTVKEALNAYEREKDLEKKNKELNALNNSLEDKVRERTIELEKSKSDIEKTVHELETAQDKLIESEKLASLGQLMAGIAHEINTPLGAITASAGSLKDNFWGCLSSIPYVLKSMSEEENQLFFRMLRQGTSSNAILSTREARKKRKEIAALLETWNIEQSLKLADQLVDMHILESVDEFKSLICHSNSKKIMSTAFSLISQNKTTNNIETAVQKAGKIVYALKSYSHFGQSDKSVETDIRKNIETVLTLYHNKIKQGVEVVKDYSDNLPLISCYPDELIQVWTNIIHNSIQAMNNNGRINLSIREVKQCLEISITDNGPGIPQEIQSKIFDAFFTTKPSGEGSGLGLDIVKKIVEKHHGKIDFISTGKGTTFTITLPKS